jgi:DNA repair photolyase
MSTGELSFFSGPEFFPACTPLQISLDSSIQSTMIYDVSSSTDPIRGRGVSENPANRFEEIHLERFEEWDPRDDPPVQTHYYRDASRTIINYNDSPDIGFSASLNPYRGCEHGCVYCYARPTHEFLGFSAGLDFESRIMVKTDAPELLRAELTKPSWKPQFIAMCGVTDPYQPVERRLEITRRCLGVLAEFRNPVGMITKNHLITRDIDHLAELARFSAVCVHISITSLDPALAARMEPRTSLPRFRLDAIRQLAAAGIPVGVMVAPTIPGLNDHEMIKIIEAAAEAGARTAGYIVLRLPYGVSSLFEHWLEQHYPDRKEKVLNQIRSLRHGKLNNSEFGERMQGSGPLAEQIHKIFEVAVRRAGLARRHFDLSTASFRRPSGPQLELAGF